MYNIDEFRTSKLHHKTEEVCDNLFMMDNNKDKTKLKERKIHAVLTFKMEKKQSGWDSIVSHFFVNGCNIINKNIR